MTGDGTGARPGARARGDGAAGDAGGRPDAAGANRYLVSAFSVTRGRWVTDTTHLLGLAEAWVNDHRARPDLYAAVSLTDLLTGRRLAVPPPPDTDAGDGERRGQPRPAPTGPNLFFVQGVGPVLFDSVALAASVLGTGPAGVRPEEEEHVLRFVRESLSDSRPGWTVGAHRPDGDAP